MTRFAILLDSGATLPLPCRSRKMARGHLQHWRETRRLAIKHGRIAIPRCAIGLVTYRKEPR